MKIRVQEVGGEAADTGMAWLQRQVNGAAYKEGALLRYVDSILDFLSGFHRRASFLGLSVECVDALRQVMLLLLGHRHEYLDQHVYGEVNTHQTAALAKVRVVLTTTANLRTIHAGVRSWAQWFPKSRGHLLLESEFALEAMEPQAALFAHADLAVVEGDEHPSPLMESMR